MILILKAMHSKEQGTIGNVRFLKLDKETDLVYSGLNCVLKL